MPSCSHIYHEVNEALQHTQKIVLFLYIFSFALVNIDPWKLHPTRLYEVKSMRCSGDTHPSPLSLSLSLSIYLSGFAWYEMLSHITHTTHAHLTWEPIFLLMAAGCDDVGTASDGIPRVLFDYDYYGMLYLSGSFTAP